MTNYRAISPVDFINPILLALAEEIEKDGYFSVDIGYDHIVVKFRTTSWHTPNYNICDIVLNEEIQMLYVLKLASYASMLDARYCLLTGTQKLIQDLYRINRTLAKLTR